ncbi:hypothetical protein [Litoribacillus peritrichatus]|uniref:Uncharacterized protein n=1 Tax=Litoribacillus peritrichatus TaxID=718191 RepID=A0ABP7MBU4_9GAMM
MEMPDQKGLELADVMGNHYLFCHQYDSAIEINPSNLTFVSDTYYGRLFLQELCPVGTSGNVLRQLYIYARPYCHQLRIRTDWDVLTLLTQMLKSGELKVWRLRSALLDNAPTHIGSDAPMAASASTSSSLPPAKPVIKPRRSREAESVGDEGMELPPVSNSLFDSPVVPNKVNLSGAASRGEIPHITELRGLFTPNANGSRSLEDMINFVEDRGSFNGNLVDYEIISSNRIIVDHGGGLKVNYTSMPDHLFDKYHGNASASYNKQVEFFENERLDFNRMFLKENPTVFVRESLLSTDRGASVVFHHEYTEIQGLYNRLNGRTATPPEIRNQIDDLHVKAVKSGDSLLGRMIISEGL